MGEHASADVQTSKKLSHIPALGLLGMALSRFQMPSNLVVWGI